MKDIQRLAVLSVLAHPGGQAYDGDSVQAMNALLEMAGLDTRIHVLAEVESTKEAIRLEATRAGLLGSDRTVKAATGRSRDAILIGPQRCGKTSHWAPHLKALGYRTVHEANTTDNLTFSPIGLDVFFCDALGMVQSGRGHI